MAFTPRPPVFLTLLALLVLSPLASSFNVTDILAQFSDFSTFNSLLTQAYLVAQINSRRTITVLAVDNSAASAISSHPSAAMKAILSVHVILDYYDLNKLHNISNHSAILTTLYQTTGFASDKTGFLNVTISGNGDITFGSAIPGSPLDAHFVKVLDTQPYNISVLHVSSVIVPPGIDQSSANHTALPPPPPPPPKSPAPPTMAPDAAPPSKVPAASVPPSQVPAASVSPSQAPAASVPPSQAPAASVPPAPAASVPPAPAGPNGSPADAPSDATADAPSNEGEVNSAADLVVAGARVAFAVVLATLGSF